MPPARRPGKSARRQRQINYGVAESQYILQVADDADYLIGPFVVPYVLTDRIPISEESACGTCHSARRAKCSMCPCGFVDPAPGTPGRPAAARRAWQNSPRPQFPSTTGCSTREDPGESSADSWVASTSLVNGGCAARAMLRTGPAVLSRSGSLSNRALRFFRARSRHAPDRGDKRYHRGRIEFGLDAPSPC